VRDRSRAAETLSTDELIIDGEVTVLGNTGLVASPARPGGNLAG
jgi:hypothetical protein